MSAEDALAALGGAERLAQLALSDTGFVFDPRSGLSFSANDTGLAALRLLRRGESLEAAADILSRDFEVEPREARAGLDIFITQLRRRLS
jgi:hypothetical protein